MRHLQDGEVPPCFVRFAVLCANNKKLKLLPSSLCGHSYCYVCIRLWFEHDWTCPECQKPMERAPVRQYAEEAFLAAAYPDWRDASRVEYRWAGLVFPKPARVIVVDSP